MTRTANCRRRLILVACAAGLLAAARAADRGYAVVVSETTLGDEGWKRVAGELCAKHGAIAVTYAGKVEEALPELRARFPRHACFVARPEEATREFVAKVHALARALDDDPYADFFWGILTGYDAENALRIASYREPLVIRKAAAGTEIALEMCEEGVWYCELKQGRMVRKEKGGAPRDLQAPADTTEALVKALTEYRADLFVTSGHATERDWAIGYGYRNGSFRCEKGVLFGLDTRGVKFSIRSPNPKVYMPAGNCLMGHIDGPDAMALAFMNSGGVNQMLGYTVPTWYGYAGWGCLDYFVEQPGRFTFTEAFFANHAALIHRLTATENLGAGDKRGLLHDRDTVAFYGDPAWEARMAPQPCAWEQTIEEREGVFTLQIAPKRGAASFEPISRNGSQRGGRPIVQFLRARVKDVQVLEGADLRPVVTDDFILVPNPGACDPAKRYRVAFRATAVAR